MIIWLGAIGMCGAQTGGAAQPYGNSMPAAPNGTGSGVLEIAPQTSPKAPAQAEPAAPLDAQGRPDQNGGNDSNSNNDVELYRTYTDSEHAPGHSGPLPYLGIAVHSITVTEPNGSQQRALEVLSVDQGSPAAAAGIKGSGTATKLGASSLTASAMLGPAQELVAPLLKKTGQLGHQGDLIVAADDNRVGSEEDLGGELGRLKPGDTLWLTVLRESAKGKPQAVRIPIKLAPPQGTGAASAAK